MSQHKPYPKYKPFGVEWIGEIPEGWEVKKLKFVSLTKFSNVDKHSKEGEWEVNLCNYVDVYYNDTITMDLEFMAATATLSEIEKFSLNSGDVIITKDSESWDDIAIPAYVKDQYKNLLCGYHLAIVKETKKINGKYLFWSFLSKLVNQQFQVKATGVTRYGLGKSALDSALFFIPSIEEQQQIANFLDKKTAQIDELIDKKEKMLKLLKEKRSAIINQAVTCGIDEHGNLRKKPKSLPASGWKSSGIDGSTSLTTGWIGAIPEGWKSQRLKFISSVISKGTTPSTIGRELLINGPVRFIKAENIQGGEIKESPEFFIDEETNKYLKRSELQEGDILFVIAGATIGKVGILENKFLPANTNQAVSFIRLSRGIKNSYVLYWLQSVYVKQITWLDAVQSAQPNLSMESLGNFSMPCPNNKADCSKIVRWLDQKTEEIDNLIEKTTTAIKKLHEYRFAIITAAVTGKIDVRGFS